KHHRQLSSAAAPHGRPKAVASEAGRTRRRHRQLGGEAAPTGRAAREALWIASWCHRGLCTVCVRCGVLTPEAHAASTPAAAVPRWLCGDADEVVAPEHRFTCRRCRESDRAARTPFPAQTPGVLQALSYMERRLVSLVQVTQIVLDLPRSGHAGQYGRFYAVPLEEPQVVQLFEKASVVEVDGVPTVLLQCQGGTARLNVERLYAALPFLAGAHAFHKRLPGVSACLRTWRAHLGHGSAAADAAQPDGPGSEARGTWESVDDGDVTHITCGGPLPAAAEAVELQRLRGLANLEDGIDARMFPHLFPQGRRGDGWTAGPFAAYSRGRLLGADPRFQQSQEYVFWLLETWLKREVSAQT
ncbi:MAG: hypothetical protein GY772_21865, partial [bacterium]|nr:hypothetical protein [bacterium]